MPRSNVGGIDLEEIDIQRIDDGGR